jgi:glycosyltransferase involved in cell wall biosynthesis
VTYPRCSLLVPCRNAARFLPQLWTTVSAQTRPFDELICYDDGSVDNTGAVARALGAKVLKAEGSSQGVSHARNQLWHAASGDWVHFHDADDLLEPDFLAGMLAAVSPETDVVICNATWRFESGGLEREWIYSDTELGRDPAAYLVTHPVGGINGLYRREVLAQVKGFSTHLPIWEDADLHVRLALAGARFAAVERSLVTAIRRPGSLSVDLHRNWTARLAALESYVTMSASYSFRQALAHSAEEAAGALACLRNEQGVAQAIRLCHDLGLRPPSTRNPALAAMRGLLPTSTLLRVQAWWRRRARD